MSYPEPRYWTDDGEISAVFRPFTQQPELTTASGAVHYLATSALTRGEFGLYRWEMGPQPSGPSPHFHKTISESFYVLAGTVRLFDGRRWIDAAPGDFLFVPQGGVHAFRNESGAPASMLLLFAPGAPRESYFETLAEIAASGRQLTNEEWTDLFARHDQYMV
jgi:mannose-6-phosphate isomerase-like protein (cupin superfamily)